MHLLPTSSGLSLRASIGRDAAPLQFLIEAARAGAGGALVTISAIELGAPRPLGSHMAVLADGRHNGHISGGCVEPAVAAEIVPIIAAARDQIVRFGRGSRFLDIRFPCGGGVDLLVHVSPRRELLEGVLDRLRHRHSAAIAFDPGASTAELLDDTANETGWREGRFVRRYLPPTRLLLVGRGPDFEVVARVAAAAEFDLHLATPDESSAAALAELGAPIQMLTTPDHDWDLPIDRWTATALLFHEHEWEDAILARAVAADGFYVGALGSRRTHGLRRERLAATGVPPDQIDRIHGPVGLIDQARDPSTLALSVLAEIASERARIDRA